jgi:hypothetical protein
MNISSSSSIVVIVVVVIVVEINLEAKTITIKIVMESDFYIGICCGVSRFGYGSGMESMDRGIDCCHY